MEVQPLIVQKLGAQKGCKWYCFVCFRAITFIPVDLFPWNFNIMILATN